MSIPFGPYELQALLGRGGMAEVFRAQALSGPLRGRPLAIKRLLPRYVTDLEYVELFAAEAILSERLRHPSIVEVLDAGMVGGQCFMAMDLIDGRDLAAVLRRCRERGILLPVDFAVFLATTLLEALAYAHGAAGDDGQPLGIVHCDVSPSNLFVSRQGEIKLGDFGLARAKAVRGEVWGKPYYLSPEAIEGRVDTGVDLWASAATLYELLCNERPFSGGSPEEVMQAIQRAEPRPVCQVRPEIGSALEDVVHRALSRGRAQRFPDAASFADALRALCDERIGNPLAIAAVVRGLFGAGR